jgi:hypothetical protein
MDATEFIFSLKGRGRGRQLRAREMLVKRTEKGRGIWLKAE